MKTLTVNQSINLKTNAGHSANMGMIHSIHIRKQLATYGENWMSGAMKSRLFSQPKFDL